MDLYLHIYLSINIYIVFSLHVEQNAKNTFVVYGVIFLAYVGVA